MAVIDVTDNGANSVVFNDKSAAVSNKAALEHIFQSDTSDGDTIDFPFSLGDQLWVESGSDGDGSVQRAIDLAVDSGLAQNLTIQGRTDANDVPVGEIIVPGNVEDNHYVCELTVDGGWSADWKHLRFNQNHSAHGQGGVPMLIRDQQSGATNDITFTNCHFKDMSRQVLVDNANGTHFAHCSFEDSADFQLLAFKQPDIAADISPRCTVKRCYFSGAPSHGGYAINHSPGHCLIEDCVIDGTNKGIKVGADEVGGSYSATWRRVRMINVTTDASQTHVEGNTWTETLTIEDVIIDSPGGYGMWIAPDSGVQGTYDVRGDFIILNTGKNGMYVQGAAELSGGVYQTCGAGAYGINYQSSASSTIDVHRANNNTNGNVNNNGNLTVSTEDYGTACATDIAGVPTANEVGIGTQTSSDTAEDFGVVDSFEDDNLTEWDGNTTDPTIVDEGSLAFSAIDGSNVLEIPASAEFIELYSTTGLSNYFPKGSVANVYVRADNVTDLLDIKFGLETFEDTYSIIVFNDGVGGTLRLDKIVNGTRTTGIDGASASPSWSADTWYRIRIIWDDGTLGGSNGDITIEAYDHSTGALLASISGNDTEASLQDDDGVGLRVAEGTDSTHYVDFWTLPKLTIGGDDWLPGSTIDGDTITEITIDGTRVF